MIHDEPSAHYFHRLEIHRPTNRCNFASVFDVGKFLLSSVDKQIKENYLFYLCFGKFLASGSAKN